MRSDILPPSEMKSLYGSIIRSAVIALSYFRFAMLSPPCVHLIRKPGLLNAGLPAEITGRLNLCTFNDAVVAFRLPRRVPQAPFGKPRFREPPERCHSYRIQQ